MLQSKARLLQLNAKLAETLTSKGVTATADETTTALVNKVADITSGDDTFLKSVIDGSITSLNIPEDVDITKIKIYGFAYSPQLDTVIINSKDLIIGEYAFVRCTNLRKVVCFAKAIKTQAFVWTNVKEMTLCCQEYSDNLTNSTALKTVYIGAEAVKISSGISMFNGTSNLEFVTLGDNFNCDNLNLSSSTKYSRETILQWLNALADRTGRTAYKLTIGATNLAKLTEDDILIATNKNWTLA